MLKCLKLEAMEFAKEIDGFHFIASSRAAEKVDEIFIFCATNLYQLAEDEKAKLVNLFYG